ncbi:MAG: TonB-dependent receptor [Bacteroidales bacterium]|nr:TonB-dependent receptor [Bacteroidales bacterium]
MRNPLLKSLSVIVLALFLGLGAFAQQKVTVSGTVTDDHKLPMMGVGVFEKGTTNGVVTDLDGNYSITVKKGSVVEFSSLGFLPEMRNIVSEGVVNVQLKPDNLMLEETVVVGYGVQKKSDVTGSISQVKSEDIQNRTIVSPEQALQGKTAGVQISSSSAAPGASPTIRIRGISSNSGNNPLYVVDGRIVSSISGLDPNDIESMEVLKDGASAAIYGAQAGNGVILITTRKGKGDGKISYSFQLTSQSLAKTPKVMNSEQYMQYYLEAGKFTLENFYRYWDFETNTDWLDYAYDSSMMQHHNLTFSAGNDRGSLYVSGAYLDNNGMFAGDSDVYTRLTTMVNASWKFKPWLDIQTNNQIGYFKVRSVSTSSDYGSAVVSALVLDPLTPTTYTADNLPDFMQAYLDNGYSLLKDENGNYYAASYFLSSENVNPRVMRDRSYSQTRGFNISGTTALNLRPVKGLTFTSRIGYRLSAYDVYGYGKDYYINGNAQQQYVSLNGSSSNTVYYQWENFANYMKQFGKHNITAMLGMSYSDSRTYGVSGSYNGGQDEDGNKDLGVMQDDPLFYYFAYTTATAVKSVTGAEPSITRTYSYFGRANWNYMGKYNLQASYRADAADLSRLPQNMRWGYFPSVAGGWTISSEPFFAPVKKFVPFLKLRASWGQNGSLASLSNYLYANVIASTGNYPTSVETPTYITGYAPSASGNDELKWETSEQVNFGFDSRFFHDRLSVNFDWYQKKTKDLIVTGITPSTVVGVTASPVNAGNVKNSGLELEVRWKDSIGNFNYGISGNIATLKNEVTYIHETLSDGIDGATVRNYGTITRFEKGHPAWYFYGYKYAGVDSSTGNALFHVLDDNGNPTGETTTTPSGTDKTEIGSGIPSLTYGLTLTAGWKGFDAVVFLSGSYGSEIYNCLTVVDYAYNRLTWMTEDRWTSTNTSGSMPAANATNWTQFLTSDGVVFSGNYLKVKQIQLGYTLPSKLTKKLKIDSVRLYGSLDDFFTFTDYPGFDPDVTGTGNSLGVDKGSYPTSKKVVFGFNINF